MRKRVTNFATCPPSRIDLSALGFDITKSTRDLNCVLKLFSVDDNTID